MLLEYLKGHKDVIYMYAGGIIDTEYKAALDKYAEENGVAEQVRYVGELCPGEQLNKHYNVAEMTIFPSKIESFGLVIIRMLFLQFGRYKQQLRLLHLHLLLLFLQRSMTATME